MDTLDNYVDYIITEFITGFLINSLSLLTLLRDIKRVWSYIQELKFDDQSIWFRVPEQRNSY